MNFLWATYYALDQLKGYHRDDSVSWTNDRVIVLDGCSYYWSIDINITEQKLQNINTCKVELGFTVKSVKILQDETLQLKREKVSLEVQMNKKLVFDQTYLYSRYKSLYFRY